MTCWRRRGCWPASSEARGVDHRNGLPLLPWMDKGAPVDLDLVNQLRDDAVQQAGVSSSGRALRSIRSRI
jgi:hypothetical protein